MISRLLLLALSVVAFTPGLLHAQSTPYSVSRQTWLVLTPTPSHKMYEDVEIFRRILDRKLQPLYPRTSYAQNLGGMMGGMGGGMMGGTLRMQGGMMAPNANFMTVWHQEIRQTLEGVYLKGHGVVYTATLASLQPPAKAETPRPVSEWERARRELYNEKDAPKKEANKPPELSDVLLKMMAENGHHFSQLGESDSLTIVITLHDRNASSTAEKLVRELTKTGSSPSAAKEDAFFSAKVRDLELLGDLHLKQGHTEEAIGAFQKALELKPERKQAVGLYRKLAQCYLVLEQIERAYATLGRARSVLEESAEAKDKPAPAAKPAAVSFPVKLIISVPKKLLDQAGEGKISAEEFRRRASVETVRFDSQHR